MNSSDLPLSRNRDPGQSWTGLRIYLCLFKVMILHMLRSLRSWNGRSLLNSPIIRKLFVSVYIAVTNLECHFLQ